MEHIYNFVLDFPNKSFDSEYIKSNYIAQYTLDEPLNKGDYIRCSEGEKDFFGVIQQKELSYINGKTRVIYTIKNKCNILL